MSKEKLTVLTDDYLYELERHFYELHLIEELTGKSAGEVLNNYTLPQLVRLMAYLDFMKSF